MAVNKRWPIKTTESSNRPNDCLVFVNLLAALEIFPFPVRVLSWLTAARGSLMGGRSGKGWSQPCLRKSLSKKECYKV